MPEFTVLAAEHKRDLPPKEGMRPSQVIALKLSDGTTEHAAEWITATTQDDAALVGTRISGTLEPSQYGMRFKKDRPAGGFGGGRPRDPKETAAIQRQHSQEMAVRLLQMQATRGVIPEDFKVHENLKKIIDWFDDDIAAGVERKHPSQKMHNGLPVHNEPVRTRAPEPTTPSADYAQPPCEHPDAGDVPWEQ